MCGRYARFSPLAFTATELAALDEMGLDLAGESDKRDDQYNIAPTQSALVVVHDDGYAARLLKWGLVPVWAKDRKIGNHAINARVETVAEKPMFRSAFKKRRALIPASGYYEWRLENGAKQPYFIHDPEGRALMLAGLWETWRPSDSDDWLHTFTIITGRPGKVSGDIHDRQPVILQPDVWQAWFEAEPTEALRIVQRAPEAELSYYPVSKAVGSPRNKGPELVQEIAL